MTYFSKSPVTKTILNGLRMEFISDGCELSRQVASARRKKNEAAAQIKSRKKKKKRKKPLFTVAATKYCFNKKQITCEIPAAGSWGFTAVPEESP